MQPWGSRLSPLRSFSTASLDGLAGRAKNTGSKTLRFLEMFKSSYYADLSLNQWLALTPAKAIEGRLCTSPAFSRPTMERSTPIRSTI